MVANPYAILDNALLDSTELAIQELLLYKQDGGQAIVDCTPDEIGRDPRKLRYISEQTGVNIIMGCGHYYHIAHAPYVKDATVPQLADEMRRDILEGIAGTDIKAGIIGEIGTSAVVTPDEQKVLKAAGIVGAQTGKAIHVHTDLYTENGFLVADILEAEGVKPGKICIDHVDVDLRPDYIRALLDRGLCIEFDNIGKEFYVNQKERFAYDLERAQLLAQLVAEGYQKQILLSNDICLKTMWCAYGGCGYSHILRTFRDMALECGVSEAVYHAILTENVCHFLN